MTNSEKELIIKALKIGLTELEQNEPEETSPLHSCGNPDSICDCDCVNRGYWQSRYVTIKKAIEILEKNND